MNVAISINILYTLSKIASPYLNSSNFYQLATSKSSGFYLNFARDESRIKIDIEKVRDIERKIAPSVHKGTETSFGEIDRSIARLKKISIHLQKMEKRIQ